LEKETPSEKVGRMIKEENSMAPKFAILNKLLNKIDFK
jgi:hypothetical protein